MTAKNTKSKVRPAASVAPKAKTTASLKTWQVDGLAAVVIFLAVLIMFQEITIGGKVFSRGDDTESAAAMNQFAITEASSREYPLWCPYVFGGFPSLAAGAYSNYEHMGFPYSLANRFFSPRYWADVITIRGLLLGGVDEDVHSARWVVALLLYGGWLTYLLMRRIGFRPLISLLSALAMAWQPYLVSLATAAHGGKLMTFIYMPLVVLASWNVLTRRRLFDFSLLALVFGWQIAVGGHTQILFYSFITVGLLYLVWLYFELKEKPSILVLKPALMIAGAILLGFGVGALWYVPLLKYVGVSIRGLGPALGAAGAQAGYSMADATLWSFHPREILTFIVPSWFGLKSPYYWGDMPFTSSSFYFGVVPLLLAVIAFFGRKDRLFWGLVAVSVFALLLSFGSHFELFYGFFFNVLPFFNKFRTPSLVLLLVIMAGIIFAGYGLRFLLELRDNPKWRKAFMVGAIACAALLLIFLIAGDSLVGAFGSFAKAGESNQYSAQQIAQLQTKRMDMLRNDLLLSLLWLGLAFAAGYLKLVGKLKPQVFLSVILLITAADLWRFSKQFFEPQPPGSNVETLRPNKVVETLRLDKSVYRVFPVGRLMQDNRWAAWEVASFGGYHGAKMRSYQDLLDNVVFNGPDRRIPLNMPFLAAMNCKYLVAESPLPPQMNLELVTQAPQAKLLLYRNPRALERVYFLDSVQVISDRAEALRRIISPDFLFDHTAVVDRPLPGRLEPHPDRTARITLYSPHHVQISASTPTPTLMVFTDAYYDAGWEAIDNGSPTSIYRVNTFARGLYLKPGQHSIEFHYVGKSEHRGVMVATLSHFIVLGLVIASGWREGKRWWRRQPAASAAKAIPLSETKGKSGE